MAKDISEIPEGDYCYKILSIEGMKIHVKYCPYLTTKNINDIEIPYCDYLEQMGYPGDLDEESYKKVIEYFGSDEEMYKQTPLSLLWDCCKECGINEGNWEEKYEEFKNIKKED